MMRSQHDNRRCVRWRPRACSSVPDDELERLAAPTLFGRWHIAPLVSSFLKAHPGVRVELVLTNRNLDLVEEGLDNGSRPIPKVARLPAS